MTNHGLQPLLTALPAPEHQPVHSRRAGIECIAFDRETLQLLHRDQLVFNRVAHHQTASALGHEADDLVTHDRLIDEDPTTFSRN